MKPVDAIEEHLRWFQTLQTQLENGESVDPAEAGDDRTCVVGTWLHGAGAAYGDLPGYADFADLHHRCHACAENAAHIARDGSREDAVRAFGGDCGNISHALFDAWLKLYYAIKKAGPDQT